MKPSDPWTPAAFQSFLRRHGLTFACAESCTGGLLSRQMTARAGSSDVFWGGAVTYADGAKTQILGVPPDLLADHGAVSAPVAEAMVLGVWKLSRVPLAAAVTGVAGPGGGSASKPVGTVWFGLAAVRGGAGALVSVRHRFFGTRAQVQAETARWARVLAARWWGSQMDLDSLRSLTDNDGKPFIEAFQPPSSFFPNPL